MCGRLVQFLLLFQVAELQAEIDDLRTKHANVLSETKMMQDVKDADVQEVISPCEVFCLLLSKIFNHKFGVSFGQQYYVQHYRPVTAVDVSFSAV